MLGDLLGNQKWVGILLELQQKLGRDLVLNCKILSSNIIAILSALLHTDYRKSIWGHLARLGLHQGVGRSVLNLGSDSAVPDRARYGLGWPLFIRRMNLLHPIRSDRCVMNTLFYWFFRGSRESANVSDYTFSWKYLIEMLLDKAEIIPI